MAGNTVNIKLQVKSDGSLEASINDTKELNRELGKAVKHAQEYSKVGASADSMQYGRARGASGLTGASARDFANEQQGLGGLVRLYATLAANTYAAATAFNFLRDGYNAAIQENALTQLSITSGTAINALAKNLVAATDGAINFKEAMSAAAKGVTSGLSSKQMLALADAAKKAGQTIGIDTAEAISRLTRGITKIEPELLDELGLFTKLDMAVTNYARSVGKSVGALTDFERRQAFANAVLKEAKDKFNDVDIPANPYEKLAAALANITLEGTKLLNSFLIPVVEFFTNNTAALAVALGLIGTKIIGMALPALSQWRQGLNEAAELAKRRATEINVSFGDAFAQKIEAKYNIPKLKENLDEALKAYEKSRQDFLAKDKAYASAKDAQDQRIYGALSKGLKGSEELGKDTTAAIEQKIVDLRKQGLNVSEADRKILQDTAERLEKQLLIYQRLMAARKALADANSKYDAAAEATNLEASLRERVSLQARQKAFREQTVAAAGDDTQVLGIRDAFKQLNQTIDSNTVGLNAFDRTLTKFRGTMVIAATTAELLAAAINRIFFVITILTTVVALIIDVFSRAEKEASKLSGSIDALGETASITDKIMKRFAENVNSVTFNAVATNANELFEGLKASVDDFDAYLKKRGPVETIIDNLGDFFGLGKIPSFQKAAAESIVSTLKTIPEGDAKEALKAKLQGILGSTSLDVEDIRKNLDKISDDDTLAKTVKSANQALGPAVAKLQEYNAALKDVKESLNAVGVSSKNLQNSLLQNDPISKFAFDAINLGLKLTKTFEDSQTAAMALQDVFKDPVALQLLGVEFRELSLETKKAIDSSKTLNMLKDDRLKIEQDLAKNAEKLQTATGADKKQLEDTRKKLQTTIQAIDFTINIKEQSIGKIQGQLSNIVDAILTRAFDILDKKTALARAQAQVGIERAIISGMSGPGTAEAQARLDSKDLAIQQEQLNLTANIVKQGLEAKIIQEQQLLQLEAIKQELAGGGTTESRETNKKAQEDLGKVLKSVQMGKDVGPEAKNLSPAALRYAMEARQINQGISAQNAALGGKATEIALKKQLGVLQEQQAVKGRTLAADRAQAQFELESFNRQGITLEFLSEGGKLRKDQLEDAVRAKDNEIAMKAITDRIAQDNLRIQQLSKSSKDKELLASVQKSKADLENQKKTLENQQAQQNQAAKIKQTQDDLTRAHAQTVRAIDHQNKLRDIGLQQQRQDLSYITSIVDFYNNAGILTGTQLATMQKITQERKTELDYQQQLNNIQDTYIRQLLDIELKINQAKKAGLTADVTALETAKTNLGTEREKNIAAAQRGNLQQRFLDWLNAEVNLLKQARDYQNKLADAQMGRLRAQQELNSLTDSNLPFLTNKALQDRLSIEKTLADDGFRRRQQEITDAREIARLADEILIAQSDLKNIVTDGAAYAAETTRLNNLEKTLDIEKETLRVKQEQAKINNKLAADLQRLQFQNTLAEQGNKANQIALDSKEQMLRAQESLNLLTPQQIQDQQKIIDYGKLEAETTAAKQQADNNYTQAKLENTAAIARALVGGTEEEIQGLREKEKFLEQAHQNEMKNIAASNAGKRAALDLQYSLTQRQKAFNDGFIKMFDGMADSIIDFVNTGKGNFSDLIDSFIKDIARYELRLQLFQFYQQSIRPGLGLGGPAIPAGGAPTGGGGGFSLSNMFTSFVGSMFGGGSSAGYGASAGMAGNMGAAKGAAFDPTGQKFAKGGAFDQGYTVHPFAMGAAFTNSIVNEPTLFKFAKGTGLMGEAGPEAIMPLTRDSSGNLGVRAEGAGGGSQVNIVINNNTGAKVQTNETTDGRGNRNVEVTIGDMVAQQIATKNSSLQQSMGAVYGNKPALARR
jgi:lambda family phage tail tape measure protein